jgi:hypothetical protein
MEKSEIHVKENIFFSKKTSEDRGSTVVKVLSYKSEGRWFDPSDRTVALGSTEPLTEDYFLGVNAAGA